MTSETVWLLAGGLTVLLVSLCRELLRFAKPHRPIDFPFAGYDARSGRSRKARRLKTKGDRALQSNAKHFDQRRPTRQKTAYDYPLMHVKRIERRRR